MGAGGRGRSGKLVGAPRHAVADRPRRPAPTGRDGGRCPTCPPGRLCRHASSHRHARDPSVPRVAAARAPPRRRPGAAMRPPLAGTPGLLQKKKKNATHAACTKTTREGDGGSLLTTQPTRMLEYMTRGPPRGRCARRWPASAPPRAPTGAAPTGAAPPAAATPATATGRRHARPPHSLTTTTLSAATVAAAAPGSAAASDAAAAADDDVPDSCSKARLVSAYVDPKPTPAPKPIVVALDAPPPVVHKTTQAAAATPHAQRGRRW